MPGDQGSAGLIRSVVEDPSHERTAPWAVWASAYALLGATTFAVQGQLWSELMLYPLLNAVLHGSVAVLSRRSRRERHARAAGAAEPSGSGVHRSLAVAEGQDDELRLCAKVFGKDRPSEFAAPGGSSIALVVLKRVKD